MLRPATRIVRAGGFGPVEHEIRLRIARGVITPVGEQVFAETGLGRRGEKPRRNDLVGVDVGRGQHDRAGANLGNGWHLSW